MSHTPYCYNAPEALIIIRRFDGPELGLDKVLDKLGLGLEGVRDYLKMRGMRLSLPPP